VVAERYIRIGIWSILKTNSADGIGKAGYRGREERKAAQAGYATGPEIYYPLGLGEECGDGILRIKPDRYEEVVSVAAQDAPLAAKGNKKILQ
jgi:hypothetical protein